ncbi:MAG: cation:proton antiporter regulatory subunit [Halohasta sp.]
MDIYETDLPGVGKRFELPIHDGSALVVVVHNTGRHEIFKKEHEDADADRFAELSESEAEALGSILEDVHFQPAEMDASSTMIGGDTVIEWYTIDEESPLARETLEDSNIREKTGVTVIAVERGPDAFPSPGPGFELDAGDTIVTIGRSDEQADLETLLSKDTSEGADDATDEPSD